MRFLIVKAHLSVITAAGVNMQFSGSHIEQPNGPVVSVESGSSNNFLSLSNMEIILVAATGTEPGYMEVQGGSTYADTADVNAANVRLYEAHHIPHFLSSTGGHVNFCHTGLMQQRVVGTFPTATNGMGAIGCDETIK